MCKLQLFIYILNYICDLLRIFLDVKFGERNSPTVVPYVSCRTLCCFLIYYLCTQMTLELKNVTSVLRPVRVIPPGTTHFSISLGRLTIRDEGPFV